MRPFRRRGDQVVAGLTDAESAVVTLLLDQLEELLAEDAPADDPVVGRLFPTGHATDAELARDYRELTGAALRQGKTEDLATVRATLPEHGGDVALAEDQARAWLRTTNDLRLALGTRLGITADVDHEASTSQEMTVYSWLTAVQGSLVDALVAGGGRRR
ncbi:DUF2017 family protein [Klenkia taihuensis]|uniref:Uncharacterized protein n=1 Tax=Klenkia taihuensis TaxID=1225127 RepID=A0A1I1S030_9ACTN|nr:DUF2017 family protein [Klenkia taihuensis]GHE13787.1 hypothetical protein GCM10011381_37610 [Klenkia taihuensis]SFD39924.1 protein of unknown function [Klenkia taihuensis]